MTSFISIAGNPKAGIAVLKQDGSICNLAQVEPASAWDQSPSKGTLTAFASIMTGGPDNTTTVALDSSIEYLTMLGNLRSSWKPIDPALPSDIKINGLVGDPRNGYTALGIDGQSLYRVDPETDAWKALVTPLPFKGKVALIAGDAAGGVLLVNDAPLSGLARSSADGASWTALESSAPIKVALITGDLNKGFVAYGEGQLYKLIVAKDAVWTALPTPEYLDFVALSGNPVDGVAALIKDGSGAANVVVYANSVDKGPWSLALMAQAPVPAAPAAA